MKEVQKLKSVFQRIGRFFFTSLDGKGESFSIMQKIQFVLSRKGAFLLYHYILKILKLTLFSVKESLEFRFLNTHSLSKELFRYNRWFDKNTPRGREINNIKRKIKSLKYRPKISILIFQEKEIGLIEKTIGSIGKQYYSNLETILIWNKKKEFLLDNYSIITKNKKNRVLTVDKNLSKGSKLNEVFSKLKGEYFLVMEAGDILPEFAIDHFVEGLNEEKVDFIYSDEDEVGNDDLLSAPYFKPCWSPDNLLSRNYILNSVLLSKESIEKIGGFDPAMDHAFLYDAFLKLTDNNTSVKHLPFVLYHKLTKGIPEFVKEKSEEEIWSLKSAIERRGEPGEVIPLSSTPGYYSIRYSLKEKGKVSIIIPTKDKAEILENCIDSIFDISDYSNFEVIVVDNNSEEEATFELLKRWSDKEPNRFKVLKYSQPFNYSAVNNFAAKNSTGEYLLFLNNDTEVLTPDWLEGMLEQAQRKSIGAVGCKLLFPNNTIQHAGVVLGVNGSSGHTFLFEPKDAKGYKNNLQTITNYSALTAACLMIRKDVFNEVKGFNEKYAVEFNDIDLCLRLRDSGFNNVYLPHVILYHYESLSRGGAYASKKSFDRYVSEKSKFKSDWQEYIDNDPYYNPNLNRQEGDFKLGQN